MKNTIIRHFQRVDPVISEVFHTLEFDVLKVNKDSKTYLKRLCIEIINQQLSSKAAKAIELKFLSLFKNVHVTPENILSYSDETLRNTGISWSKVQYIKDLAQKFKDKKVDYHTLYRMEDTEIIKELTQVKGIGPWTAEMFLIFVLGRENVYSHGDLGLKNAMKVLYNLKDGKTLHTRIQKIVNKWSPYRSYGCLALWHSVDNEYIGVDTVQ